MSFPLAVVNEAPRKVKYPLSDSQAPKMIDRSLRFVEEVFQGTKYHSAWFQQVLRDRVIPIRLIPINDPRPSSPVNSILPFFLMLDQIEASPTFEHFLQHGDVSWEKVTREYFNLLKNPIVSHIIEETLLLGDKIELDKQGKPMCNTSGLALQSCCELVNKVRPSTTNSGYADIFLEVVSPEVIKIFECDKAKLKAMSSEELHSYAIETCVSVWVSGTVEFYSKYKILMDEPKLSDNTFNLLLSVSLSRLDGLLSEKLSLALDSVHANKMTQRTAERILFALIERKDLKNVNRMLLTYMNEKIFDTNFLKTLVLAPMWSGDPDMIDLFRPFIFRLHQEGPDFLTEWEQERIKECYPEHKSAESDDTKTNDGVREERNVSRDDRKVEEMKEAPVDQERELDLLLENLKLD